MGHPVDTVDIVDTCHLHAAVAGGQEVLGEERVPLEGAHGAVVRAVGVEDGLLRLLGLPGAGQHGAEGGAQHVAAGDGRLVLHHAAAELRQATAY